MSQSSSVGIRANERHIWWLYGWLIIAMEKLDVVFMSQNLGIGLKTPISNTPLGSNSHMLHIWLYSWPIRSLLDRLPGQLLRGQIGQIWCFCCTTTWPDPYPVWPPGLLIYGHLGRSVVWPPGLILDVWPPRPDLLYGHLAWSLFCMATWPDSVVWPPRPDLSSVWPLGLSVVWPPRPDLLLLLYDHLAYWYMAT